MKRCSVFVSKIRIVLPKGVDGREREGEGGDSAKRFSALLRIKESLGHFLILKKRGTTNLREVGRKTQKRPISQGSCLEKKLI